MIKEGEGTITTSSINNGDAKTGSAELLVRGTYLVRDDDLKPGKYIFNCTDGVYDYMDLYVFESFDDYMGYFKVLRTSNGDERNAVEQNALQDFNIRKDDRIILNLQKGMVVILLDGEGVIEKVNTAW